MRWEGRLKRSGAEEEERVAAVKKINPGKVKLGGQRRKFRNRGGQ